MERRNRPSRIKEQFNDHNGDWREVGKTKSQEALLRHNELAQHKVPHAHQLDTCSGKGGEADFFCHKNYLYTSGATQDFLLSIT